MKVCTKCKESKDESEFYHDPKMKLGLQSACKKCHYIMTSNYIKTKEGKASCKKCREKHRGQYAESHKKYYQKNRDKILKEHKIYNKIYRDKNREDINRKARKFYSDNPENRESKNKKSLEYYYNNRERILKEMKEKRDNE